MENKTIVYIYFIGSKELRVRKMQWGFLSFHWLENCVPSGWFAQSFFCRSVLCFETVGVIVVLRGSQISSIFHMLETTFHMGLFHIAMWIFM